MTVKQLRKKLEKYPDDMEVVVLDECGDAIKSSKLAEWDFYYCALRTIKEKCVCVE